MHAPSPKPIWTNDDFESMGWHDNVVHAIALQHTPPWPGRLLLDVDYIVEWVCPPENGGSFGFWISPSTLVFDEAADFRTDISLVGMAFELWLDRIVRSPPDQHGRFEWTLQGPEFTMGLSAPGFTQYLRRPPTLSETQSLSAQARGGPSFAIESF